MCGYIKLQSDCIIFIWLNYKHSWFRKFDCCHWRKHLRSNHNWRQGTVYSKVELVTLADSLLSQVTIPIARSNKSASSINELAHIIICKIFIVVMI